MKQKIITINATYINAVKLLQNKGYLVKESLPFNEGRYYFIKTDGGNFMVVFKREFFMSFGTIFKDKGESGVGETLNQSDLKDAILCNAVGIIFTYPDEKIYSISVSDFIRYSHKRMNIFEGKETRSINIKHLVRENAGQTTL